MSTDKEVKIFTRLPVLRAERGISRKALAEHLRVHYQTIGYIERGEYVPSLAIALAIAEYFGLPVESVFSVRPFAPISGEALALRVETDDG